VLFLAVMMRAVEWRWCSLYLRRRDCRAGKKSVDANRGSGWWWRRRLLDHAVRRARSGRRVRCWTLVYGDGALAGLRQHRI